MHQLHIAADDVLKHGQHRGESRKRHEQEEQAAPQPAHGHVGKNVGQGDKNEAGAGGLVHAISKAGRENDEAGRNGYECIQHHHTDGLAQQRALFANVAAKDGHGTHAQAQGEERLVHSTHQRVDDAHLFHAGKVRHQIELEALSCPRHEQAVDGQDDHDDQQSDHHDFGHTLQAVLQATGTDKDAEHDHHDHPERHDAGACQHLGKGTCHFIRGQAGELARSRHVEVMHHPAGHGGVEHHQQVAANEGKVAVDVPFLARLFQCLIGAHRTLVAGAAHCKLHAHDGQAQDDQEQQIEQHERAAAALAGHVGEFPYVSDADGTARGKQDKPKS